MNYNITVLFLNCRLSILNVNFKGNFNDNIGYTLIETISFENFENKTITQNEENFKLKSQFYTLNTT
jgi:hypothetical protein